MKLSIDFDNGGIMCRKSMGLCFGNKKYFDFKLFIVVWGNDYFWYGIIVFICFLNVIVI